MPLSSEVDAGFWANVWRCTHRHPCKKCCWPWKTLDLSANWKCIWQQHAVFYHKDLHGRKQIAAARAAYEFTRGPMLFTGQSFHICHQCHFGPCCNPWHVLPGTWSDNTRDTAPSRGPRTPIRLPDGRLWAYDVACAAQASFYDARQALHVYAGTIPLRMRYMEYDLYHPDWKDWRLRPALGRALATRRNRQS